MGKIRLPTRMILSYPFCDLRDGTWFVIKDHEATALYCKVNGEKVANAFEIVNLNGEIGTTKLVNVSSHDQCITVAPDITVTGTMI